jgi:hypothetical protein
MEEMFIKFMAKELEKLLSREIDESKILFGGNKGREEMLKFTEDEATKLATDHVEWFLSTLKPLLISHFVHGFKHGVEDSNKDKIKINVTGASIWPDPPFTTTESQYTIDEAEKEAILKAL